VPTAAATGGLDVGGRPAAGPADAAAANQGAARRAEALEGLKSAFGDLAKPAFEPPARGRDYRPAPEGPASPTATPSESYGRAGAGEAGGGYPYRGAADSVHYSGEPAGLRADESKLRTEESGKDAVDIAQALARMQRKQTLGEKRDAYPVQERAGRRFVRYRGVWVDERFAGTEGLTKVKWGSEAYFRIVRERPDLKDVFTLGRRLVVVTAKGKALVVDIEDGREDLPDEDLKALFTDAAP
jgi:hypothetical protein